MSIWDELKDPKCLALKTTPIFWQAAGAVIVAKSQGVITNYNACINYDIPGLNAVPLASDYKDCVCKYVFQQVASGPVILFADGDFQGANQAFDVGWHLGTNGALNEVGNDKTSSIIVADGYICDVWDAADGRGTPHRFAAGLYAAMPVPGPPSHPATWNDCISSIHVLRA